MGAYGQSIIGKSRGNIQVGGNLLINPPPAQSAPSNWFTLDEDFIRRHQTLKESDLRNYLEGEPCKWALVIREQLAERPLLHRLLSVVRKHDMVALLGPGAEGKTTLLMQTAYRLFRDGWTVFYFTGTRLLGDVPKATRESPCIYIADNAPLCDDLKAFLQTARRREWRVLLAGRQNEWNRYAHEHTLETRGLTALETEKTDRPEADAFAAYLSRQPFISAPEDEIRNLFLNNSNGFLYAAMLEAVRGQPLEEIARDILHNIQPPNHENPTIIKTIALLCVMEGSYRKCTRRMYREILKYYGLKPKRVDRLVEKEIQMTGGYMETRHPDISALFARYIERDYDFETEEILRDFLELCFSPDAPEFFWNWKERERFIVQKIILKAREFPELFDYAFTLFAESPQPHNGILDFFLKAAPNPSWQHKLCVMFYEKCYLNRESLKYPDFFLKWGAIEESLENIGDVEKELSARWIYRQGTDSTPNVGQLWRAWGQLEERLQNYGASVEEEYSARWVYRQGSLKASFDNQIWNAWINFELTVQNRTRGFEIPHTAEWIAETGYRSNQKISLLLSAVCLAMSGGEYDKARKLLAEYVNQEPRYILNAKQQADNSDGTYAISYGFYICCKLSGMKEEAEAIAQAFADADVDIPSVKARCQEIWAKHPVYAPLKAWLDANP